MSGYIKGYGKVPFDIMNYDNNVYDYMSSLHNTYGREFVYEDVTCSTCQVFDSCGDSFICDCDYHIAYVIDHES